MTGDRDAATVVRAVAVADHAAWLALWAGYQAFYQVSVPADATAVTWARLLDPAEPMRAFVAERGGRVVGLAHAITHRSSWTRGDYCYLQDLFVDAAARGGGVGRRLIEHVRDTAQAAGCSRVYWLTHETNHDAMALYDKLAVRSGFIQYRIMLP